MILIANNRGAASRAGSLRTVSILPAMAAATCGLQQQAVSIRDWGEPLRDSAPTSQHVGETKSMPPVMPPAMPRPRIGPLPPAAVVPSTTRSSMSRKRGTVESVAHTVAKGNGGALRQSIARGSWIVPSPLAGHRGRAAVPTNTRIVLRHSPSSEPGS